MPHTIKFGQNATLELVMAGLEANNGAKLDRDGCAAVETLGHLWGFRRKRDYATFHFVEHISISALAERKPSSVSCESGVLELKDAVAHYLRPELTFLGDFHTHPYSSAQEVLKNKGWQDSDTDRDLLIGDDKMWEMAHEPLMIVLAIAPMSKVHESEQRLLQNNVLQFNIAEYRFWLAGYVGENTSDGRAVTGRAKSNVNMSLLPLEVWDESGARLKSYGSSREDTGDEW